MRFTAEHRALQDSVRKFIASEIDPHVAEWEKAGIFPAHELFRKMGALGFLGVNKPAEFGGLGLDYSFEIAYCEAIGGIGAQGVSMALAVQTDMATPALARFGSDELRREFLAPILAVRVVGGLDEALAHVARHGSGHTEAIVTPRAERAARFRAEVDAACVVVNASTRFHDGGELGLGAEIGIATSRLHWRGPMGLEALTTMKWIVDGEGQIRG